MLPSAWRKEEASVAKHKENIRRTCYLGKSQIVQEFFLPLTFSRFTSCSVNKSSTALLKKRMHVLQFAMYCKLPSWSGKLDSESVSHGPVQDSLTRRKHSPFEHNSSITFCSGENDREDDVGIVFSLVEWLASTVKRRRYRL